MAAQPEKEYPELPREVGERYLQMLDDPTLQGMLDKGMSLDRMTCLYRAWGVDLPHPWTVEHEMEVPDIFRDPSAITPDPHARSGRPLDDDD